MSLIYYSAHEVVPQEYGDEYTNPGKKRTYSSLFIVFIVVTLAICIGSGIRYYINKKNAMRELENRRNQLQDLESVILNNSNEFEIVPSYTENPDPQVDLGIYTSSGKLVLISRPTPTYQPDTTHDNTSENLPGMGRRMLGNISTHPNYAGNLTPIFSTESNDDYIFENASSTDNIDVVSINSADTAVSLPPSYHPN